MQIDNIMTDNDAAPVRVRLVDWAYTLPDASLSPYARMKKAKLSFFEVFESS